MFIGFDYGTANCSVAIMRDGHPQLLTMENNSALLPSMLCAPTREAVSEWLYRHHDVPATDEETQALLRRAIRYNREEDIEVGAQSVQFGLASLAHYIDDPQEVWFVKSPKSFLGASGLKPQQVALFEDLVCAMMVHIRHTAHSQLPEAITQAVIGRPINFQGLGGDDANRQAQGILERAAKRAGFQEVVFQYEPVAAGLDYEATLREEKRVLVVDIGGGTTDCSMLLMGPQWRQRADRENSLLGHSGCRVGGNDLDIALAFKNLMPLLGMGGETEKGIALPVLPWWNAVAINDVPAQSAFYSSANGRLLNDLVRNAREAAKVALLLKIYFYSSANGRLLNDLVRNARAADKVALLLTIWRQRLSYRLVRCAEESKIALSGQADVTARLPFISDDLAVAISQQGLEAALDQPLARILEQVQLALDSAQEKPDVIYLTGGSARSPLIKKALSEQLPGIPVAGGDDFGSVTAGLARWAEVVFR
ncbi:molecular chaperone [Salmonella enterica]|nr:molecular chaperone [Salmonella enterica]